MSEYQNYFSEAFKGLDSKILETIQNINFHDCKIIGVKQSEHSLKIMLDNSGAFTEVQAIQFDSYMIIKQDFSLANSWWLYEEIYIINDKYELHVLLHNHNCLELGEFIISANHISFTA